MLYSYHKSQYMDVLIIISELQKHQITPRCTCSDLWYFRLFLADFSCLKPNFPLTFASVVEFKAMTFGNEFLDEFVLQ